LSYKFNSLIDPAEGETPDQTREQATYGSIGVSRFSLISYRSWSKSPPCNPVIDRTYAVDVQTGRLTRWKPASPAAAWYVFDLFGKKVALRATFFPKRMVGSALPEAKFPFGFVTA